MMHRYRTCAVIANGPGFNGGFNKSEIIDSYDAVLRNNYFPFSDIQVKTSTLNISQPIIAKSSLSWVSA